MTKTIKFRRRSIRQHKDLLEDKRYSSKTEPDIRKVLRDKKVSKKDLMDIYYEEIDEENV